MQIYWNKRKHLHKKRVQLPQDWFGTQSWPPWRHVKTLYTHFIPMIGLSDRQTIASRWAIAQCPQSSLTESGIYLSNNFSLVMLTVFLASQEKFDGSAPTVHWLVRPELLPRSPGNTSFIDRRAEVSATNRGWNNCFSVQVRRSTLIWMRHGQINK